MTAHAPLEQPGNRGGTRRRGRLRCVGFTLVELIIVIVILGMVASIAIPRLSRGTSQAPQAALESDLRVVRSAILRYAIEHDGAFPGPTELDFVKQLTAYTDVSGVANRIRTARYRFGPYLVVIPPCPVGTNAGSSRVLIDATNSPPRANTASGAGWVYNPNTGEFYANTTDVEQGGVVLSSDGVGAMGISGG